MNKKLIFNKFNQSGLDLQYNNRKRVPEVESFYEHWIGPSKLIIDEFVAYLDLPYGSSEREKIDIIVPKKGGLHPINIYFHGGYWMSRSKSDQTFLARPYVESGAVFAAVEYDLIPDVRMSDIVGQCKRSLIWISKNAGRFNIDLDRIYISGHSAGAHLASILLSTNWGRFLGCKDDIIKGGCIISGIYDLIPVQLCYIQETLQLTDSDVNNFSPFNFNIIPKMPIVVAVGSKESEEFIRQSRDFVNQWNAKGANCSLLEVSGCNHFDILESLADAKSVLFTKIKNQMGLS